MESCVDFIREKMQEANLDEASKVPTNNVAKVIKATGGGAHKYYDLIQEKLKMT